MDPITKAGEELIEFIRTGADAEVYAFLQKAGISEPAYPSWGTIGGIYHGGAAHVISAENVLSGSGLWWNLAWTNTKFCPLPVAEKLEAGKTEGMPLAA